MLILFEYPTKPPFLTTIAGAGKPLESVYK